MGILEVKDVNKRFGGLQALGNVNLSVAENSGSRDHRPQWGGQVYTLLNCLIGKLAPDTGSVTFQGQSVLGRTPYEINQMGISRVFQTPEIFTDLTVMENMLIPCFAKRDGAFRMHAFETILNEKEVIERAEHMLEEVNMTEKLDMVAGSMSRGDKRRLEMAMCLVQAPSFFCWTSRPQAWRGQTPTTPLICSSKFMKSMTSPSPLSSMTCMWSFPLAQRITVLAQGTPLVEDTTRKISRVIRRAERSLSWRAA